MAVVCAACGNSSQDLEFCDHCNADLGNPDDPLLTAWCPLPGNKVELTAEQRDALRRPESSITLAAGEKLFRVHRIGSSLVGRWLPSALDRQRISADCLPPSQVIEEESDTWIFVETSGEPFAPWSEPPCDDELAELNRLLRALEPLTCAVERLHDNGLCWANFDPLALERTANGEVRITNLDLAVYRTGVTPEGLSVHNGFAAPETSRFSDRHIGPATDVFHIALFAYYWLAGLLPDGFPGSGLEAFGHVIPPLRLFRHRLAPGIAAVLARGLALDASQRWQQPREFLAALHHAMERFNQRRQFQGGLCWEIGSHTRTGRTKSALGRGNEDSVVVRQFSESARALLAVTDGISTCDVGSGALASLITTIVLENSFTAETDAAAFSEKIADVCRRTSQALVDWALEKGYRDQLLEGADLMGTTLTVGWLEGRSLLLANLGDSRAYLVDEQYLEQLTVDGDLGTGLLAAGTPPEEVRELGPVAKALRECIGGCSISSEGEVAVLDESCHPMVLTWPLMPGDILLLCSDGLVEEGVFLDPETLAELTRSHRDLPPDQLAVLLADAADARQRMPSAREPEGLGDNIACIVVRIKAAAESTP